HVRGAPQIRIERHDVGLAVTDTREYAAVHAWRHRHRIEFLHVVRHDDAGDRTFGDRDAYRAIHDVARLRSRDDRLHVFARNVLEQAREIDLLLKLPAERRPHRLTHDREHGLMVELGVVEPVQQMDRAGPGRGHAHAEFARELGMRAGHERGHFLVARTHVVELVAGAIERAHETVDAIAGVTVYTPDLPLMQSIDDEIGDSLAHGANSFRG